MYIAEFQAGAGSVRFVSVPDFFKNDRFGSVRFGSENQIPGSTRFGLRFSDVSWLGPVRFGSFPRPVPAGSRIKLRGSVRPVRFGFLFLPAIITTISRIAIITTISRIATE